MLRNFRTSESGNVAIMFAFALLPLLGGIGLAVDYARMSTYQAQMQSAVDAAALSLAYSGKDLNEEQLKAAAEKRVGENFENSDAVIDTSVTVERGTDFVSVSGNAHIKTTLMNLLGHSSTNVNAFGKAVWGSTKLEVVLVLDNSGSMGNDNRLVELKKASKALIDILEEAVFEPGSVKIGLVPFATAVRVNPALYQSGADWLTFPDQETCTGSGKNKKCTTKKFVMSSWRGCIVDRKRSDDLDTHDRGYDYKPVVRPKTLSPAVQNCPKYGNEDEKNLGFIAPLSENFSQMKTSIDSMVDGGFTNMTIGMTFGTALLTQRYPFEQGAPDTATGEHKVKKIIIALSDGANTRSVGDEGDDVNGRSVGDKAVGNSTLTSKDTNTLNVRNKAACAEARATKIDIYTILLVSGNESLLKECATTPEMFRKVSNSSELIETFRAIGKEITKLRLAV